MGKMLGDLFQIEPFTEVAEELCRYPRRGSRPEYDSRTIMGTEAYRGFLEDLP